MGSPLYYAQPSQVMAGVFMLSSYVVTHSTIVIPWTFTRNLQVVGFQSYSPRPVLPWTFTRNLQVVGFQSIPPGTLHARYCLDVYT